MNPCALCDPYRYRRPFAGDEPILCWEHRTGYRDDVEWLPAGQRAVWKRGVWA